MNESEISLNRPKELSSLTLGMVRQIEKALDGFEEDLASFARARRTRQVSRADRRADRRGRRDRGEPRRLLR
jgi:hypothetical protein